MPPRWLAICALAACATAPVAPAPAPAPRPAARPAVVAPSAPPSVEPAPEPALPPCPTSPRDATQLPAHVIELVGATDAMTVVDLGSGDGYFLCPLSRAVGPRGRVIATEVSKVLVRGLERRVAREQLPNVDVVHASRTQVGFARADRILLVNVWHHLPARKRYAARIARALAPGGKVIVVDFERRRRGGHGIAPAQVIAELGAGGIDAAVVPDDLPAQYVIIGTVR